MSEQLLNASEYKKILDRCFKRNDLKFVSSTIKPLSENVEGYLGEHYTMIIKFMDANEQKEEHFFIKTKPVNNQSHMQILNAVSFFEIEIFMYFLFAEFDEFGFDTSFAAKCYYCVPGTTIVMENLLEKGFVLRKKRQWYTMVECQCGLQALARMHAASFVYEAMKSKETGQTFNLLEQFPNIFQERAFVQCMDIGRTTPIEKWLNSSLVMCKAMVDYLPKTQDYKAEFKRRLENVKLGTIFVQKTNIKRAIGHGDLWSNNMFFRRENNLTTRCVLIDYQFVRYFYPAYDVLNFIYSNTNAEFRNKYFAELKNFYYNFLKETLKIYGYSVEDFCPRSDYEESLGICDFCAMYQAFATHALSLLPEQYMNKDMMAERGGLVNLVFEDRLTSTLEAFKTDEEYKQMIIEEMEVLFKLLEED